MAGPVLSTGAVVGGRYRLDELLGQGGMGVVWAATHTITERVVALKFLHGPGHLRPELRQRFLREARAASAVRHPNVVDVLDVFELDDETPVMVMERLIGETLGERLARERALSLDATAALLVPVVSAVATAHARGIVHRDLKPDNVFIARAESGGEHVKVLDFGIAKLLGAVAGEGMTETGLMLGTPWYMAPEQASGQKDVDHRADVWALGAIVYECLTGSRPVEGENLGQVLMAMMNTGVRRLADAGADLPADVTDLVDRMLARDREARPSDLAQVLAVLERHTSVRAPISVVSVAPVGPAQDSGQSLSPDVDVEAPTELGSRPETAPGHAMPSGGNTQSLPVAPRRGALLVAIGGVLAGAVAIAVLRPFRARSPALPVSSSAPTPPLEPPRLQARMLTSLPTENPVSSAALAPDGSRYAYTDASGLWIAPIAGGEPRKLRALQGPDGRRIYPSIAFMPDGRAIAALTQARPDTVEVALVPVDGSGGRLLSVTGAGSVPSVADVTNMSARPDGREIVVAVSGGLVTVDVASGRSRLLTALTTTESVNALAWSPGGSQLAMIKSALGHATGAELVLVETAGTGLRRLLADPRLVSARSGAGLVWRDERRLLFSRLNDSSEPPGSALWEIDVAGPNAPAAAPRKIFTWDRYFGSDLTFSTSARRLSAVLGRTQGDVFIGDLSDGGRKLAAPRRLTLHDGDDRPSAWTGDGRVLSMSDRYGTWDVLAQRPDGGDAKIVAGTRTWETWPKRHGASLVFWRFDQGPVAARRTAELVSIDERGRERRIVERPIESELRREAAPPPWNVSFGCAGLEQSVCVLGETVGNGYVFRRIDPSTGSVGAPIYERVAKTVGWELSPDGRSIAVVGLEVPGLVIVSVATGAAREIKLASGTWQTVHFMPDANSVMLTGMDFQDHSCVIVRADLHGKLDLLHTSETAWFTQALPSPDGKRLAFGAVAFERNVQVLDGL